MKKLVSMSLCVLGLLMLVGCGQMKVASPLNGENLDGWQVKGDAAKSKWVVGKPEVSPDDPPDYLRVDFDVVGCFVQWQSSSA